MCIINKHELISPQLSINCLQMSNRPEFWPHPGTVPLYVHSYTVLMENYIIT